MARPTLSAKVLSDCSQTKEEIQERIENEELLKGEGDKIISPEYLTIRQKAIFDFIVEQLKASGILGNLDIYILSTTSIAIERLEHIETLINKNPKLILNKDLMSTKDKYTKDFFRGCTELSLSPAARSKIANINSNALANKEDPLMKALAGEE